MSAGAECVRDYTCVSDVSIVLVRPGPWGGDVFSCPSRMLAELHDLAGSGFESRRRLRWRSSIGRAAGMFRDPLVAADLCEVETARRMPVELHGQNRVRTPAPVDRDNGYPHGWVSPTLVVVRVWTTVRGGSS